MNLPADTVVIAEDMLVKIDWEREEAAVTGQMVVYSAMVLVVKIVCTASVPSAEMAEVSVAAGQFVIVGAHEMTVLTWVAATVIVVRDTLANGPEPAPAALMDAAGGIAELLPAPAFVVPEVPFAEA